MNFITHSLVGLSTRVLTPDLLSGSPIPDSRYRVSSTQHVDYTHCTVGLDLMTLPAHCHAAQQAARIWMNLEWSLDPDPRSVSDPDLRSCVENANVVKSLSESSGTSHPQFQRDESKRSTKYTQG